MRSRLSTAVFLRCHCWFCIACSIQFHMTSINPPPSGRQHNPPLYMWVTSCGVVHVETDLHAVTQYALAQVPRQKPYNYHVLLDGQGIPTTSRRTRQSKRSSMVARIGAIFAGFKDPAGVRSSQCWGKGLTLLDAIPALASAQWPCSPCSTGLQNSGLVPPASLRAR